MSLRMQVSLMPVLIATLALAGCGDEDGAKYCGTDLNTQINATIAAATALEVSANAIASNVATACANIATDLGEAPTDPTDVEIACSAADRAIAGVLAEGVVINIAASPPVCTFEAQAQLDCEAGCVVEADCEPGTIEARCEPGEFSVQCEGECAAEASVICEADVNATITCEGSCNGICEGSCSGVCNGECTGSTDGDGNCNGDCLGTCEGSCQGTCEGSCELDAEATGGCDADATVRCRGGCTHNATLPRCEAQLTPPSCEVDVDCQASCEAEASFNSECEPGKIHVVVVSGSADDLVDTLRENLPILLAVEGYAGLWANTEAFADGIVELSSALQDNLLCLGARASALAGALESAATAAVSVSVTVEFSACASASTGGTGETSCE